MKKIIALFAIFASTFAFSQVGIGTNAPNENSILDLRSTTKGFLLPRLTTTERTTLGTTLGTTPDALEKGMQVVDITTNSVWYWDGTKWVEQGAKAEAKFFYMPSITVDVSTTATGQTLDLYTLYKAQFDAPAIKSTSAPADVPFFAAATDLYYYVTSYDTNAMTITSIDDNGLMTYNVSGLGATPCSLLNIVFVYK